MFDDLIKILIVWGHGRCARISTLREDQNMTTKSIELRKIKEGEYFRRKPDAHKEYIRGHYNRKDSFGPASFTCTDSEDIGRCIQLKPSTIVYVEAY